MVSAALRALMNATAGTVADRRHGALTCRRSVPSGGFLSRTTSAVPVRTASGLDGRQPFVGCGRALRSVRLCPWSTSADMISAATPDVYMPNDRVAKPTARSTAPAAKREKTTKTSACPPRSSACIARQRWVGRKGSLDVVDLRTRCPFVLSALPASVVISPRWLGLLTSVPGAPSCHWRVETRLEGRDVRILHIRPGSGIDEPSRRGVTRWRHLAFQRGWAASFREVEGGVRTDGSAVGAAGASAVTTTPPAWLLRLTGEAGRPGPWHGGLRRDVLAEG